MQEGDRELGQGRDKELGQGGKGQEPGDKELGGKGRDRRWPKPSWRLTTLTTWST